MSTSNDIAARDRPFVPAHYRELAAALAARREMQDRAVELTETLRCAGVLARRADAADDDELRHELIKALVEILSPP